MPIPILMPALSPTMEEGKLAKWLVKEGDTVAPGDVVAEIETDKATMEVEAVEEGTLGKILVDEGTEGVAVNKPIAVLLGEGEDESALKGFDAEAAKQPAAQAEEAAAPQAEEAAATGEGLAEASQPAPGYGRGTHPAGEAAPAPNGQAGRVRASPLARRLAREFGLELTQLQGSGPYGRIIKRDVERAAKEGPATAVAPAAAAAPGVPAAAPKAMSDEQIMAMFEPDSYELVPHDNMRKTIAERLTVAKSTIPHFYLSIDCELDALMAARQRLNARAPKEGEGTYKLSVNDLIIKAMGLALRDVPTANAVWTDSGILISKHTDVAVAVAVEGGLFTPVLRDVGEKSLVQLSTEMRELADRARKKRLAPHEYQGATTSISNLGMYGIRRFDAVINPPHATILSIGQAERRPVVKGNEIEIATVMACTLSCDHRVVDGALGAQLLSAFKGYIEEPVTMLA
ncbi:pyruvate dehydrogenase complex dihydrolipoamide acetyltransferase [Dichotomicrobium thermohalophilum]|uniref:Acetyltransferase component of pyruvate dehydrogenase complex n=1 Tax=Dichotomicrobium thermohalophilum TaxID=933063 RepID=A0A397QEL4_9HYPH|nr:pyruvate dehydrogenase complex dihydrolipoamide acetyltransferase [Dichotomicrobium thermohalophilum]RIA56504.1 pyruvate dehydrogenase E2 component (dihydrolipoamide acetyltransferase) [Dichotomicrobium thermohalophilum]